MVHLYDKNWFLTACVLISICGRCTIFINWATQNSLNWHLGEWKWSPQQHTVKCYHSSPMWLVLGMTLNYRHQKWLSIASRLQWLLAVEVPLNNNLLTHNEVVAPLPVSYVLDLFINTFCVSAFCGAVLSSTTQLSTSTTFLVSSFAWQCFRSAAWGRPQITGICSE